MMQRQLVLLTALLGSSLFAQSRELHIEVTSRQETPCIPSWTATLDKDLANTLLSGPDGAGSVTVTIQDYYTLGYTAALKGGVQLESLMLRLESEDQSAITVPLAEFPANMANGTVTLNDTLSLEAIDMLVDGGSAFAEATTTEGESLIGAFSSDCQPTIPQLQVEWAADEKVAQLPSCIVPGFSQLYVIPENCSGFNDRVPAACNVQLEDILLASAYNADGELIEVERKAVCLPEGCSDPCAPEQNTGVLPALMEELPASTSTACNEPGFEVFYPVPDECEDLPGGLEESCYLNLYDVVAASYKSMWLSMGGICLPPGCDPCKTGSNPSIEEKLADAAPFCKNTYYYTQAYEIPQGCGDFTEALRNQCGLDAEAIASATGMEYFPAFAGFGPGKTVCLPEYCQPCQPAVVVS